MDDGFPDPARHARGWRLALTLAGTPPERATAELDGRRLLLVARPGGGWWALDDRCRRCGEALSPGAGSGERVQCPSCGAEHGPARGDTPALPVMLVDDEVYVLLAQ